MQGDFVLFYAMLTIFGKKGQGRLDFTTGSSTSNPLENIQAKKTALREAIKAFWECKTHSYGEHIL